MYTITVRETRLIARDIGLFVHFYPLRLAIVVKLLYMGRNTTPSTRLFREATNMVAHSQTLRFTNAHVHTSLHICTHIPQTSEHLHACTCPHPAEPPPRRGRAAAHSPPLRDDPPRVAGSCRDRHGHQAEQPRNRAPLVAIPPDGAPRLQPPGTPHASRVCI